jgi:hypothetical protein
MRNQQYATSNTKLAQVICLVITSAARDLLLLTTDNRPPSFVILIGESAANAAEGICGSDFETRGAPFLSSRAERKRSRVTCCSDLETWSSSSLQELARRAEQT